MANTSSSKGNPASHRMSNAALKERRKRSWVTGKERRQIRQAAQEQAHRRNVAHPQDAPWLVAKRARATARALNPEVQRRAREYSGKVL